jgi:hypothetical protein
LIVGEILVPAWAFLRKYMCCFLRDHFSFEFPCCEAANFSNGCDKRLNETGRGSGNGIENCGRLSRWQWEWERSHFLSTLSACYIYLCFMILFYFKYYFEWQVKSDGSGQKNKLNVAPSVQFIVSCTALYCTAWLMKNRSYRQGREEDELGVPISYQTPDRPSFIIGLTHINGGILNHMAHPMYHPQVL